MMGARGRQSLWILFHRGYHSKDIRPRSTQGWWGSQGLAKSGYPRTTNVPRDIGVALNLQERLDELYAESRARLNSRTNIGFSSSLNSSSLSRQERLKWRKNQRSNSELERAARLKTLVINTEDVRRDHEASGALFHDIYEAGELYGIYEDLFPNSYFIPNTNLNLYYETSKTEIITPVFRGNHITPREASKAPSISWNGESESFYTLIMTTPDGHFKDESKEYLHWMRGNMRGGNGKDGLTLCSYLQPFPPRGAGYFRYIFILYKQTSLIDFSEEKIIQDANLESRTFVTMDFYNKYRKDLTPCALSFFQSEYDSSLTEFYHTVLNYEEPRYEYDFLPPYVRPWNLFTPHQRDFGFNNLLDRHRDPKEIQEEVLLAKLKEIHPFEGDLRTTKYPLAHKKEIIGEHPYEGYFLQPSWRLKELEQQSLRQNHYKDMDWKELQFDPTNSHA